RCKSGAPRSPTGHPLPPLLGHSPRAAHSGRSAWPSASPSPWKTAGRGSCSTGRGLAGQGAPRGTDSIRVFAYDPAIIAPAIELIPQDVPTDTPLDPSWPAAVKEALTQRPELIQIQQEIEAVELRLRRARNLLLPDLRFFARYNVTGAGNTLGKG